MKNIFKILLFLIPYISIAKEINWVDIDSVDIAFDVLTLSPMNKNLKWNDVYQAQGRVVESDKINFQTSEGKNWIKFGVKNTSNVNKTIIIQLDIVYLEHFKYYILNNSHLIYESKIINWKTPMNEKSLNDRYFSFPLSIPKESNLEILIEVQGSGGVLFVPLYLYHEHDFLLDRQKFDTIFEGIAFIYIIFTFIVLFAWIVIKKPIFFYLWAYIFSYLLYILNLEGYLVSYAPFFLKDIKWLSVSGTSTSFFSILFTLELLGFSNDNRLQRNRIKLKAIIFTIYFISVFLFFVLPHSQFQIKTHLFYNFLGPFLNIFLVLLYSFEKKKNTIILFSTILPGNLLKIIINYSILSSFILPFLSSLDLYYLKYIIPIYDFSNLSLATILLLYKELKSKTQFLEEAQLSIIHAQETERQRIAKDLHDDLGGTLSAIKGRIANEKVSQEAINLVERAIDDLRYISRNLSPPELENDGLIKALHNTIGRIQISSNIKFTFITFGEPQRLNQDEKLNVYRIITELINNILKHSKAQKAVIQLIYYQESLNIIVEDDGIGIKSDKNNWGIGLKNINSRVEFLGAKLNIDSSSVGTTVIIELPLKVNK